MELNNKCFQFSFWYVGVVLVTDAMQAMGLAPGRHHLGSQQVDVTDRAAYVAGTNTLSGRWVEELELEQLF